ncbi:MAG: hypothetical protein Q8M92_05635, partial [Candidatus Subteraquimicrobiales bacterium]|nr:hypothetical protein [Candidatus Subteraquimicrobiales bacterium]
MMPNIIHESTHAASRNVAVTGVILAVPESNLVFLADERGIDTTGNVVNSWDNQIVNRHRRFEKWTGRNPLVGRTLNGYPSVKMVGTDSILESTTLALNPLLRYSEFTFATLVYCDTAVSDISLGYFSHTNINNSKTFRAVRDGLGWYIASANSAPHFKYYGTTFDLGGAWHLIIFTGSHGNELPENNWSKAYRGNTLLGTATGFSYV